MPKRICLWCLSFMKSFEFLCTRTVFINYYINIKEFSWYITFFFASTEDTHWIDLPHEESSSWRIFLMKNLPLLFCFHQSQSLRVFVSFVIAFDIKKIYWVRNLDPSIIIAFPEKKNNKFYFWFFHHSYVLSALGTYICRALKFQKWNKPDILLKFENKILSKSVSCSVNLKKSLFVSWKKIKQKMKLCAKYSKYGSK